MRRIVVALAALAATLTATPAPAHASQLATGGYTPPPFAAGCTVYQFGEGETPPLWLWLLDPVCVEYSKRDITLDNGGALRFLLAEPARFALAAPACRYWQQDHWSVQTSQGAVAIVAWDGNYWYDKRAQVAAMRLANFRINGTTVGIGDAVIALRDQFPDLAQALADYGTHHGETGLTATLPYSLWCALRSA